MDLPPPKLQDLSSMACGGNSAEAEEEKVWEVSVPSKNGLYWTILLSYLSYLLSSEDNTFRKFIDDLCNYRTKLNSFIRQGVIILDTYKIKLLRNQIYDVLKFKFERYNPFEDRHSLFFEFYIMEIIKAFKEKLNEYANVKKCKDDVWNDELILAAASNMLECKIDVYISDEKENKFRSYSSHKTDNKLLTIILFQYKNQTLGTRKRNINVFRYAMTVKYAHPLKLHALACILKKTKVPQSYSKIFLEHLSSAETHGENFLSTIFKSNHSHILPFLYRSPYIALRLSQAGFETNPAESHPDKLSAFFYAAANSNTKYIRILYDYAANCRYDFQKTVRNPNQAILESLKKLHIIFSNDNSNISNPYYGTYIKERAISIQSELCRFNEYQQSIASSIINLKVDVCSGSSDLKLQQTRKKIIQKILEFYVGFFYYNSPKFEISELHRNYLRFNEYYENLDSFSCLSFFDNLYQLKKMFQIKDSDIFASTESAFLILTMSNKYFPKLNYNEGNYEYSKTNREIRNDTLRLIPLLYRESLKTEIECLLKMLSLYDPSPIPQNKIEPKYLRCSLSSFPEARDELLIYRVKHYLNVAIDVSFADFGIKSILVLERALQVLGESLNPQWTKDCVVSCLLGARLPMMLNRQLINIRNVLSHYSGYSAYNRLAIESNYKLFHGLKVELEKIRRAFKVVFITQEHRLSESLIENSQRELSKQNLDKSVLETFQKECEAIKYNHMKKTKKHSQFNKDFIKLSVDIVEHCIKYIDQNDHKVTPFVQSNINAMLNSIKYTFTFLAKNLNKSFFGTYLGEIQFYCKKYQINNQIKGLTNDLRSFFQKYKNEILKNLEIDDVNYDFKFPMLNTFIESLDESRDLSQKEINFIVNNAEYCYDEAAKAKDDLIKSINMGHIRLANEEEELLKKLIISTKRLNKLRTYLHSKDKKLALKELEKDWISKEDLKDEIEKMFSHKSDNEIVKTLMIKMVYQTHLKTKIYTSVKFKDYFYGKIGKFFMKKINFLLSRIFYLKSILIYEHREVKHAWTRERNDECLKKHIMFLMRQRFLADLSTRASLEMAFLDCLNILNRKGFEEIYEKLNHLLTGINLRNVLSHGHCILETIGGLLDEDDLPSELINKMLELIKDHGVILSMQQLIFSYPGLNTLEEKDFKNYIENYEGSRLDAKYREIKRIKRCPRWKSYLCLFPLL